MFGSGLVGAGETRQEGEQRDGRDVIVETDGLLPPADPVRDLGKKILSSAPVQRPRVSPDETVLRATFFSPVKVT